MKKCLIPVLCLLFMSACGGTATKEIDLNTDTAENADFSSADLARITDGMMNSISANGFYQMYAAEHAGQKPVMLLAKSLLNNTDEHINTRLILEKIRTRMINEGQAQFVDDQAFDMALDQLNLQASDLYDNAKAAKIGKFVGAKYVLRGSISNIRKRDGRENINFVNVTMDIFEVETLLIKWTDEVEFKRASTKGALR
ncbi:MAG: penicillin-binding protein activator LpoB [Candidatus Krumholzibacteria bacterium]|nr:penicillin-binding protein activator LpoB [Candidatus Krumholzibacteria bacterium]